MITLLTTKQAKGRQIVEKASRYDGKTLSQVYDKWSWKKAKAYERCYDMYLNTPNRDAFSICSHNSRIFTCSWLGRDEVGDFLMYITPSYDYKVYFID